MTPKQIEKTQTKIKRIRAILADEKRKFGWFDDSRGLRYVPPELYLKIQDFKGALTYFRWFSKNFPDDVGFPYFLLEWTIVLYKNKKIKEAEKKAIETFFSNTYLIDKFLDKELIFIKKYEGSSWERKELIQNLKYSKNQSELKDFSEWLEEFVTTDRFYKIANKFIEIEKQLLTEPVGKKRSDLVNLRYQLLEEE